MVFGDQDARLTNRYSRSVKGYASPLREWLSALRVACWTKAGSGLMQGMGKDIPLFA